MSTTTPNLSLVKPELTDTADITAMNGNWDIIDTELKKSNDHIVDKNNPHGVTKEQVGLGNVPNVSTNEQTPTWEEVTAGEYLVSGDTLSKNFGRLARIVRLFLAHTLNKSNPHNVTKAQLGLGNVDNTADADKVVKSAQGLSSTLSVASGGTGATTAANARTSLGITPDNIGALPIAGGKLTGQTLAFQSGISRIISGSKTIQMTAHEVADNFDNTSTLLLSQAQTLDKALRLSKRVNATEDYYNIFGEHNKPSGTYTGNGSSAQREISIVGVGRVLVIEYSTYLTFAYSSGAINFDISSGTMNFISPTECRYINNKLYIATTASCVNKTNYNYTYFML